MKQFLFAPEPDITAYELALLFARIKLEVTEEVMLNFPKRIQRHFVLPKPHTRSSKPT